jgi:GH35 family endo-1,4-beta-xylanase
MKGRLVDWDVINEPYNNNDVMKILGDAEMIAWFKLARRLDPDVRLTLNDFAILSEGGLDARHQDHFEKTLRFLKDGGAPITGLGMQSHFGGTPTPPEKMLSILDRYAAIGLDISITEHDIDSEDEQLQADFTRDFLTAVFSHPSVVAILTWGFWENSHWRPKAAYYRKDWSVTPAGQAWLDLVTKKWWTNVTLETAAAGTARTRGFLGDYQVTVTYHGVTKTVPAKLTSAGAKIDVCL